jgi:putative methyltransferase
MINVQWVNYNTSPDYAIPDLGWLSFKTYYEENSDKSQDVNWLMPVCDSSGTDSEYLARLIVDRSPDLVAFSTYVWNVGLNHSVAQIVRKMMPDVKIVFGGPHIEHKYRKDFFQRNPHVDLVCHVDAYGEAFFKDLLDQLVDNNYSPADITYAVYPSKTRFQLESTKTFYKRGYQWPRKIYEKNKDYIDQLIANNPQGQLYYLAETSRGCPFGCVFCEWGGGINSKVSFKPTEYVLEDLDFFLDTYKPIVVGFTDANFGIIERDIDITKHFASKRPDHPQIREFYLYGQSKVNKKILFQIYEELAKINLMDETVKVSVQDFEEHVLKNIDRTDVDWRGHRDFLNELLSKYNYDHLTIKYEMILGLPGSNLDTFYKSFDYLGSTTPQRYTWWMLPTSPAANPDYRNKYKLGTIKNVSRWAHNEIDYDFSSSRQLIHDPRYGEDTEIVVESDSYTKDDWIEMFLVNEMYYAMISSGLMLAPIRYLETHRPDVSLSATLRKLMSSILYGNNNLDALQKTMIADVLEQIRGRVYSGESVDLTRVQLPKAFPLPGDIAVRAFWLFVFMIDIRSFYSNLTEWADEIGDPLLRESIDWNSEFLITLEYDPTAGKVVKAPRDWHEITFNKGSLDSDPVIYTVNDKHLIEGGPEIMWHRYPIEYRLIRDFVKYCGSVEKLKTFQRFKKEYASR